MLKWKDKDHKKALTIQNNISRINETLRAPVFHLLQGVFEMDTMPVGKKKVSQQSISLMYKLCTDR